MFNAKELLIGLTEATGSSGDESTPAALLREAVNGLADTIETDSIGNTFLYCAGEGNTPRPRVMITAHTDEISLMVAHIDKGGFLRVAEVGGFDPRTLLGQEVIVHGKRKLPGVVGSKPPHLSSPAERNKSVPLQELFIDLAMPEESVRELVNVGSFITISRRTMELSGGRLAGKAMDNRAGVTTLAICLSELRKLRFAADVYAVGTVQEEIGCKGAQTAAFRLLPDLAVAIDVCHGETPGVASDLVQKLGGGPVVSFGPRIHPKLFKRLTDVARDANIPVQIEVTQGPTWTDADPIQIVQAGIPTALISIPLRYMHTSVETLAFEDVRHAGLLLARFIASLDMSFVEGLTCYLKD